MTRVPPRTLADQDSHTPKNYILDIQFSTKEGGKLLILLRRENYGKPSLNGIGIQMVKLSSKRPSGAAPVDKLAKKICWYQVRTQTEPLNRKARVLVCQASWALRTAAHPSSCPMSQCTESLDRKDVLALKWTNTLLLGNNNSGAIVIEVRRLNRPLSSRTPFVLS
jgi:hypothetical protein